MLSLYGLLLSEHMRGYFASLSMRFIGGLSVIENNCINNLHSFIFFDLISLRLREALFINERGNI
jgi:hypothetical protein